MGAVYNSQISMCSNRTKPLIYAPHACLCLVDTVQDAFATMCGQIKAALKAGVPLVLNAGDYSPHFLEKLCQSPKYRKEFPENVFNPRSKAWHKVREQLEGF